MGHRAPALDNPQAQVLLSHPSTTTISSSLIRRLILAGEMEAAALALGRPYGLSGTVVGGHRIGSTLGYPTANIEPLSPNKLVPAIGIYAVWVTFEGATYKGMLSIGRRPTLHADSPVVIEVHLLHFSGNLYGKTLTLHFMKRFRQEEQFPDVEALVAKLKEDEQFVEDYLSFT
jgi:riboflavin kinase/FMN adenylyltransferase